jgi:hypothetical protein
MVRAAGVMGCWNDGVQEERSVGMVKKHGGHQVRGNCFDQCEGSGTC